MTNKIAIFIAVIMGIVAAMAASTWMENEKQKQKQRFKTVGLAVAKKTLRKNDVIRLGAGILQEKMVPQEMVLTGSISTDQLARYRGYVVKERIDAGQPITVDKLEPPYDKADTNTSVVSKGFRAITISVDMVAGVAGLIRPADRVDVIGTFDLSRRITKDDTDSDGVVTLYILQNARVIALDRNTEKSAFAESSRKRARNYRTVTLEVKPEDSMRIINANEQGRLRLILRNKNDVALEKDKVDGNPIATNIVKNELKEVVPYVNKQVDTKQ